MWSAGAGLRRRTTLAAWAAKDGSPSEAEANPQPEVDFKFKKNWRFRMDTAMKRAVVKGKIPVILALNKMGSHLFSYNIG